jgi:hypothetical protein
MAGKASTTGFTGLFAEVAKHYGKRYGSSISGPGYEAGLGDVLGSIAAKNHHNGMDNPYAQMHRDFGEEFCRTISDKNPMVAEPLRRTDCSPVSDGAAAVVLSTNATGAGKGRYIAIVEMVLFGPALVWCPLAVAYDGDTPGWVIPFDMCWPLSMLGMLVIGIAVAKVGRYRGLLRWQLLLCGLWLPVAGVGQAVIGDDGGTIPGTVWLGITYGVLGLRLAFTPRIVLPAPAPVEEGPAGPSR